MAIRAAGGTGVLVALIVFIMTTIFFLVMTIVFYSKSMTEQQKATKAGQDKQNVIRDSELQSEAAKLMLSQKGGQSLYGHMMARHNDVSTFVMGSPAQQLDQMKQGIQIQDGSSVKSTMDNLNAQLRQSQNEVSNLQDQLNSRDSEIKDLQGQVTQAQDDARREVDSVRGTIAGYEQAANDYRDQTAEAIKTIEATKEQMSQQFADRQNDLEGQIDELNQRAAVFQTKNQQLQKIVDEFRVKARNPAELVDGRIIDVIDSSDQVFIDIGSEDRVVPGMTFEVYDNSTSIRVDPNTRGQNRGKASIQVIKVGDVTSTARVTRRTPGRSLGKDDVIANAVFSPDYRFRFLVHGKFDINGDGRPTTKEADYLRSKIIEWGGEVVDGSELTGDLDFLVLGDEPPMPPPLPPDATDQQFKSYLDSRTARDQYEELFQQASEAQIPVLNWNRFEILTGTTNR